MPGAHKIGAAISGPRIAGGKVMGMRTCLNHLRPFLEVTSRGNKIASEIKNDLARLVLGLFKRAFSEGLQKDCRPRKEYIYRKICGTHSQKYYVFFC